MKIVFNKDTKVFSIDSLSRIKSFNKLLNTYRYGYPFSPHDRYGLYPKGFNNSPVDEYDTIYRILSPSDFHKYKMGFCTDYTLAEAQWFRENLPEVKFNTFNLECIGDKYGAAHDFLVFYINDKLYLFESSIKPMVGIREFDSINDLFNNLIKFSKSHNYGNGKYALRHTELNDSIVGMNGSQYAKYFKQFKVIKI